MTSIKSRAISRSLPGLLALTPLVAEANGVFRNGAGARSMSLGGASVGSPDEPLEAVSINPAGLGLVTAPTLQLGAWGALADGRFSTPSSPARTLSGNLGVAPEVAVAFPIRTLPVVLGAGITPDAAAGLDWNLRDAPGGLTGTTSYGDRRHFAQFVAYRAAVAASVALGESWILGGSVGASYNQNSLEAPYTFQSHPVLRGFKTLLDLQTDGWGVNGSVGLLYRPQSSFSLGVSYHTPTFFETTGSAVGNAAEQLQALGGDFATVRPDFRYDARVKTALPQSVSLGGAWQFHPRARALLQLDWIHWRMAFDELDIRLTGGNNADLNTFLGSNQIHDVVPLNWHDRLVYRAGFEFTATESILLRAGYAFGESPVPGETFTPMSAAILEHTLTAGVEWRRSRYSVALAYQYDLPATSDVGTSALRSFEYSNSRTRLQAHWLGITTSMRF